MNKNTKMIILSLLGVVGLVLTITINSLWVSAGVVFLLSITAIGMSLSTSSGSDDLDTHLQEFEDLLLFKRNQLEPIAAEPNTTEDKLNHLAKTYESILEQDTKVAGEMVLLADKVGRGHYYVPRCERFKNTACPSSAKNHEPYARFHRKKSRSSD